MRLEIWTGQEKEHRLSIRAQTEYQEDEQNQHVGSRI